MKAYIGLGSNRGDRLENLRKAVSLLPAKGVSVIKKSSVYETEAVGPPQPDFLNAVIEVDTDHEPEELYRALKEIEAEVGRKPSERWGPREIDLDLLLYEDRVVDLPHLKIPHPEITNRAFVLVPLFEIAPTIELTDLEESLEGKAEEVERSVDQL